MDGGVTSSTPGPVVLRSTVSLSSTTTVTPKHASGDFKERSADRAEVVTRGPNADLHSSVGEEHCG